MSLSLLFFQVDLRWVFFLRSLFRPPAIISDVQCVLTTKYGCVSGLYTGASIMKPCHKYHSKFLHQQLLQSKVRRLLTLSRLGLTQLSPVLSLELPCLCVALIIMRKCLYGRLIFPLLDLISIVLTFSSFFFFFVFTLNIAQVRHFYAEHFKDTSYPHESYSLR